MSLKAIKCNPISYPSLGRLVNLAAAKGYLVYGVLPPRLAAETNYRFAIWSGGSSNQGKATYGAVSINSRVDRVAREVSVRKMIEALKK